MTTKKKNIKKTTAKKAVSKKKATAKKKTVAKKKPATTKKVATKKTAKKKTAAKKTVTKKAATKKKATAKKKTAAKKAAPTKKAVKKVVKKKTTAKKKPTAAKKAPAKKAAAKKTTKRKAAGTQRVTKANKMSKTMQEIAAHPVVMPRTLGKKKKITAKDKRILKKHLLEMSRKYEEKIDHLKKDSLLRNDSRVDPEDGTDVFERQFNLSIASTEQKSLAAIYDALKRLEEGTYGICEGCGDIIGTERLKALPFAKLCIKCKSESEKNTARPKMF